MKRIVISFAIVALIGVSFSCTKQNEPEKVEKSVRERAQDVGKFADKTFTSGLEDKLTDIVDKNDERTKELEEAAGE